MLDSHSFQSPEDGQPPHNVRIQDLWTEPWPEDARRIRVHLETTPFLERPNIDIVISDKNGLEASSITIIESIDTRMVFTLHLRGNYIDGLFTLFARLYYPEIGEVDNKTVTFEINSTA
jgi:hypothetical protein